MLPTSRLSCAKVTESNQHAILVLYVSPHLGRTTPEIHPAVCAHTRPLLAAVRNLCRCAHRQMRSRKTLTGDEKEICLKPLTKDIEPCSKSKSS